MVVDTSALLAILRDEPEGPSFAQALEAAADCVLSAASFVEASMVIEARYGPDGLRDLDRLIAKANIEIVAADADQAMIARRAFSRFGKGRHAAGLNFGDCFAYALAEARGSTLLFKGDGFRRTDIPAALP